MKQETFQQQTTRKPRKRVTLVSIISVIPALLITWLLFFPSIPNKKIAVIIGSARKDITPYLYQGFDIALPRSPDIFPTKVSMINDFMDVQRVPDKEARYQIDDTTSYKGRASLKIDAQGNGIGFKVRDVDSSDISLSVCARAEKGQKGHLKIWLMKDKLGTQQVMHLIKHAKEVDYIWQRCIYGHHFPQKVKDIIVIIVNTDDTNPVWIDELNVRKEIISNKEIITERTISAHVRSLVLFYAIP